MSGMRRRTRGLGAVGKRGETHRMLSDCVEHGRGAAFEHPNDDELGQAFLHAALVALAAWRRPAGRTREREGQEGAGCGMEVKSMRRWVLQRRAPSDHSRRTRSGQNLLSAMSCSVRGSCFGK